MTSNGGLSRRPKGAKRRSINQNRTLPGAGNLHHHPTFKERRWKR